MVKWYAIRISVIAAKTVCVVTFELNTGYTGSIQSALDFATSLSQLHLQSHSHTHTIVLLLFWNLSRTTWVSRYQKGKNHKSKTNQQLQ